MQNVICHIQLCDHYFYGNYDIFPNFLGYTGNIVYFHHTKFCTYKTFRVFTRLRVRFIKLIFLLFWDVPWLWDCYTSVFELQEMIPVVVKSLGQFLSLFDTILFKQLGRELFAGRLPGVNGFVVRFTRHCQKESREGCK